MRRGNRLTAQPPSGRAPFASHADRFFIGGQWVKPSSDATIKVIDSGTEEFFFSVAEAQAADISRAVEAARQAFDTGPWPQLTHAERAGYLRAIGALMRIPLPDGRDRQFGFGILTGCADYAQVSQGILGQLEVHRTSGSVLHLESV